MVIYQDWASEFWRTMIIHQDLVCDFLRTVIMNLRNHQRSVLVSNSRLTFVPTSVKWLSEWLSERRDGYPPVNSLRVYTHTLIITVLS